jgi:thioesterase domain-containing protein
VPELAAFYAEAICQSQPTGPLVVAGWSAGASIALEIAHRLRVCGRETALLVAIEGAPEVPAGLRTWDPRYWLRVARHLPAWFLDSRTTDPGFLRRDLSRLAKSYASRAASFLRRRKPEVVPRLEGIISLDRYPTTQRRFMSRLYQAIIDYRPEIWDGPATLYEARVGPALSLPQYLARWRKVAPRTEHTLLEGNHLTIMREPHVANLARDLEQRVLAAARRSATS